MLNDCTSPSTLCVSPGLIPRCSAAFEALGAFILYSKAVGLEGLQPSEPPRDSLIDFRGWLVGGFVRCSFLFCFSNGDEWRGKRDAGKAAAFTNHMWNFLFTSPV